MENVVCNLCGSNNYKFVSDKGQYGLKVNVVICEKCGLVYLNPRDSKEKYIDFYKYKYDYYYREKKASINLGEIVFKRLNGTQDNSNNFKKILEVGSGEGNILSYFKSIFPESNLSAIEPSVETQKELKKKGITIITNDIDKDWTGNYRSTFDLVILRHVLEHLHDPTDVMLRINDCLTDNGIIYIAVPNTYKAYNLNSYWFRYVHTYYFNPDTLLALLTKTKFNAISIKAGDKYNNFEVFAVANKSKSKVSKNLTTLSSEQQKKIIFEKLNEESKVKNKVSRMIEIFVKRIKIFFIPFFSSSAI